ncbi:MAG: hypothetical protein WBA93_13760 [Microcoleaceae cyanobacterium]
MTQIGQYLFFGFIQLESNRLSQQHEQIPLVTFDSSGKFQRSPLSADSKFPIRPSFAMVAVTFGGYDGSVSD